MAVLSRTIEQRRRAGCARSRGDRERRRAAAVLGARLAVCDRRGVRGDLAVERGAAYVLAGLFVFFLSGLINYWLAKAGQRPSWFVFATGTLDIVLLTILIVTPNPFDDYIRLMAMGLREGGFKICWSSCAWARSACRRGWRYGSASPRRSAGRSAVIVGGGQPGTIIAHGPAQDYSYAERMRLALDPNFVDIIEQATHVVVILIIAGMQGRRWGGRTLLRMLAQPETPAQRNDANAQTSRRRRCITRSQPSPADPRRKHPCSTAARILSNPRMLGNAKSLGKTNFAFRGLTSTTKLPRLIGPLSAALQSRLSIQGIIQPASWGIGCVDPCEPDDTSLSRSS